MPPGWLASLDDYAFWLEDVVHNSSGTLLDSLFLEVEWLVDAAGDDVGLNVERQRLVFHDGTVLGFDLLVVRRDLECEMYHFDYRGPPPMSQLVWRLDKHVGHPHLGLTHLHVPNAHGTEDVVAVPETDLAEAVQRIHDNWRP